MASNFTRNVLLVTAVLALSACKTVRSPDLPFPETTVSNFSVSCPNVAAGQTVQCTATATCKTTTFDAQGNATTTTLPSCPATQWSSNPTTIGTIDNTGNLTGVSPGTVDVTANINGATRTTQVTVSAACVKQIDISINPPTAVSGTTNMVAGSTQKFSAVTTDSLGHHFDVSDQTDWSLSPPTPGSTTDSSGNTIDNGHANGTSGTVTTVFGVTASDTVHASYPASGVTPAATFCTGTATPVTATAALNITPAKLLTTGGLCIETSNSTNTAARTAAGATGAVGAPLGLESATGLGACSTPASTSPLTLTSGSSQQFVLRARYDFGTDANGKPKIMDYDATNSSNTTLGSDTPATMTVTPATSDTTATSGGLAKGVALGTANVTASFQQPAPAALYNATPYPVKFSPSLVMGMNSLGVSGKDFPTANNLKPTKFACVGATNAVAGLQDPTQLKGQLQLIAKTKLCDASKLDTNGNCAFAGSEQFVKDVTNDDDNGGTLPGGNQMHWTVAVASSAYWDGGKCTSSGGTAPSAHVGDKQAPQTVETDDNGVVTSTGSLVLGFSCVTAQYTNPALGTASPIDGMTVLTLPVTNDDLLNPSATDPTQSPERLCDVLEPVFDLGGTNDGSGAVTQILSTVVGIVNPLLQGIDTPGNTSPVTQVTNQLVTALNPLTGALVTPIQQNVLGPVNTTVVQPLYCGLGTLLNGLLTLNPTVASGAQACLPALP